MTAFSSKLNERFGSLVASSHFKKNGRTWYVCLCDCGNTLSVAGGNLHRNDSGTRSCGCSKTGNPTHGLSRTITYKTWKSMRGRCTNLSDSVYKYYGGRGIKICKRWDKFENFLADMGERPSLKYSLDRINNDGDYKPSNCRWATSNEQRRNQRNTIRLTHNGQTKALADWAEHFGVPYKLASSRHRREMPFESIFSREHHPKSRPAKQ